MTLPKFYEFFKVIFRRAKDFLYVGTLGVWLVERHRYDLPSLRSRSEADRRRSPRLRQTRVRGEADGRWVGDEQYAMKSQ